MADLWSGSYTFLLTDIEGSTRLWENAPADMARALVRHDDLVEHLIAAHGGRLVRSRGEGDSAFAVFDDASAALSCAVELQRALSTEPWPASAQLRVRMAVHAGPAQARGDDYFGQGVNRAARIRTIAHGGQLLVSDDVQREVAGALPAGVWLRDLGLHRLKDLARPERVWQVGHQDLMTDFPPLRSLDARGHNLPVQLTAFVGREAELVDVRKRLETTSLLTLTGPGGIGKTRLAVQAGAEAAEDHPDGVWLVELAGIADPTLVIDAIASALGVREEAGRDLTAAVVDHLTGKKLLLIIDNCEHVIDHCAHVVHRLLKVAEGLRVLATSREPLRVYGEALYSVPPLDVPESDALFPEEAMHSAAVRLFADRATLADRTFTLAGRTDHLLHICRRLEGMPLAIELAAAMVGTSDVQEIARRLDDRLGSLEEGPRTAPRRQQTLRAAIDWSYELLTPDERLLFERLSAFGGGCTADAARAVAAWDGLTDDQVPSLMTRLCERSLLVTRDEDITRYRMLDTVREYATARCAERGELDVTRARHAVWASDVGRLASERMRGPEGTQAMATFNNEQDNFRAALQYAIEAGDPVRAGQLVRGIFYAWFVRGMFGEGRAWLRRVLDAFPDLDDRATMLLYDGQLANAQGDVHVAIPVLEESIELARARNERSTLGIGLNALATSSLQLGRLDDVKRFGQEALTILRTAGDHRMIAQSLNVLGVAAALEGDDRAARNYYEDALAISRESGMKENIARLLMNLGNMALAQADFARARDHYAECREAAMDIGDAQTASGALANLGVVAKAARDFGEARELLTQALDEKRRLGDGRGQIVCLQGLGDLDRREGRYTDSRLGLAESLILCRDLTYILGVIQGLEALASTCADETGLAEPGLRFAAAADAERDRSAIKRNLQDSTEFDEAVRALRAELGPAADDVWSSGRAMGIDAATNEAIAFGTVREARSSS